MNKSKLFAQNAAHHLGVSEVYGLYRRCDGFVLIFSLVAAKDVRREVLVYRLQHYLLPPTISHPQGPYFNGARLTLAYHPGKRFLSSAIRKK